MLVQEVEVPEGMEEITKGPGFRETARALVTREPERFGENQPGEPIRGEEVHPWFELGLNDIAHCQLAGDAKDPNDLRHCALLLEDGSGFVLNAKNPPAHAPWSKRSTAAGGEGSWPTCL